MINPVYESRVNIAVGGLRKQDAFRAVSEMNLCGLTIGKCAAAFHHKINLEIIPCEVGDIGLLRDANGIAAHHQFTVALFDLAKKTAVRAVVAGKMRKVTDVRKIIDRHDAQVGVICRLVKCAEYAAANATVAVNSDLIAHSVS